ncbi:MAG: acyl-CoA dehydrogenase, partial [Myxococcales bacterium]
MDFSFTENQTTVRDLARGILDKEVTPDRVKALERTSEWFDRPLWATLAEAGLLGLAVDEEHGGMGFGLPELAVLLGELGRVVAPVPALVTLAYAGLPIAIYGTDDQKARWLSVIATGELVLSAALSDAAQGGASSSAQAESDGGAWVLTGRQAEVPSANVAAGVLVTARVGDGAGLFMVDPTAPGATLTGGATSTGEPLFTLDLDGVRVEAADVLGGQPASGDAARRMLEHVHQLAVVATCAAQVGVSEKALEITAGYVSQREQFGAPIGTFQAVQHRAA